MWGETRYNVLVKQIEVASDHFQHVVATVEQEAQHDQVARNIVRRFRKTIEYLDRQALKMLAPYDPAALVFLAKGMKRDPRRIQVDWPIVAKPNPANVKPKALKPAPEVKKKKKHYHPR